MNPWAFIYMRMDSSRLAGKHFKELWRQQTLIDVLVARALRMFSSESLCLLTSNRSVDDPIEAYARKRGLRCCRGSANDLVNRTRTALVELGASGFFRINGDSPLVDFDLYKKGFRLVESESPDFVTNLILRTCPYGVAFEYCSSDFYLRNVGYAQNDELEHVTKHLYRTRPIGKSFMLTRTENLSSARFVVDTAEDLVKLRSFLKPYNAVVDDVWTLAGGKYRSEFACSRV